MGSSEPPASGAAAGACSTGACCWAASCWAYFCCWWRFTPPATTEAVPAITAVRPTVRRTGRRRIIGIDASFALSDLLETLDAVPSGGEGFGQLGHGRLDQVPRHRGPLDDDAA